MAVYSVTFSDADNYGATPKDRYTTRRRANERFEDERGKGHLVRIVRWIDGEPKEMDRANG